MTFSAVLVLGWLGLAPSQAPADAPVPTTPSASIPPSPAVAPTDAPPPPPPAPGAKAPTFTFTLLGKSECIAPCTHGDAKAEDGKAEVSAEDNQVKAVLT